MSYILDATVLTEQDVLNCVSQMWMSARSPLFRRVSISVSTLWAPTAASATPDTSWQDTTAPVSQRTQSTGSKPITEIMSKLQSDDGFGK